jgi:hypothetical protein
MQKLSTRFTFYVHTDARGYLHLVVTRLTDGATKYFFQAHGTAEGMTYFMCSMTDELIDGYYPKAGKKGSEVDNWAFLGDNPGRAEAEAKAANLAGPDLTHYRLTHKI